MSVRFGLLGPFLVTDDDGDLVPLRLRRQERVLLAELLLAAGRIVSAKHLTTVLWGAEPPATARGVLQTYLARLRAQLLPHGIEIRYRPPGYAIAGRFSDDVTEFRTRAARALRTADAAERVARCDAALGLWRGALPDGVDGGLADLRLSLLECRAQADLELGRADRVVLDLTAPAAEHPGRERLAAALVLALYRCGRPADALRHLAEAERAARAIGIEPGDELQTLGRRIADNDPRLDRAPGRVYEVRVRGVTLPWSVAGHPALELCNTWAGWGGPHLPGAEWLRGYPVLAVWSGHVGLVDDATVTTLLALAARRPVAAADALDEARALRAALHACLTDPGDRAAFATVAGVAQEAARLAVLRAEPDGLARWRIPARAAGLRLPVLTAGHAAAELLTDARRHVVRACASPHCGWLFLDESGRRRWCSLASCGADAGVRRTCGEPAGRR